MQSQRNHGEKKKLNKKTRYEYEHLQNRPIAAPSSHLPRVPTLRAPCPTAASHTAFNSLAATATASPALLPSPASSSSILVGTLSPVANVGVVVPPLSNAGVYKDADEVV